jgi:2'-5' RNA ligase
MRLFVAIELDDAVRERLTRELEPLRALPEAPRGLRWLPAQSWHVTLQFLGEVQDSMLDPLRSACAQAGTAVSAFEPAADLRPLLPRLQLGPFAQRVTRLTVVRSHLSQHGSRYEALFHAELAP